MPPSSQKGCGQGSLQRRAQPAGREGDEGPIISGRYRMEWKTAGEALPAPPNSAALWAPGMAGPLGLRWGGHLGMG